MRLRGDGLGFGDKGLNLNGVGIQVVVPHDALNILVKEGELLTGPVLAAEDDVAFVPLVGATDIAHVQAHTRMDEAPRLVGFNEKILDVLNVVKPVSLFSLVRLLLPHGNLIYPHSTNFYPHCQYFRENFSPVY